MPAAILSLGTAVPARSISQARAAELAGTYCLFTGPQARLLPVLYRRACVEQRGSVLLEDGPESGQEQSFFPPAISHDDRGPTTQDRMERYALEAPPLAIAAGRRALDAAGVAPRQITQLVTVTCTGFSAPGIDRDLIHALGLAPTVGRTQVGFMGCHGALNGLRVAAALTSGSAKSEIPNLQSPISSPPPPGLALLCAVELCTLHFFYGWDPEKIVANAIFADGAAAAVIGPDPATPSLRDTGYSTLDTRQSVPWRLAASGSCLFPDSDDAMTWRIDNHGFVMTLSARVPDLIAAHLPPWIEGWLREHGLSIRDVPSWAIHPGGPRIIRAVTACLGLPDSAAAMSEQVLAECGNMSSPTLLFILDRLRRANAPRPCVAIGFGPGLAAEAALLV